jgi:hypothetical protein
VRIPTAERLSGQPAAKRLMKDAVRKVSLYASDEACCALKSPIGGHSLLSGSHDIYSF